MKFFRFLFALIFLCSSTVLFAAGQAEEAAAEADKDLTVTYYMWDDPTYMEIIDTYNNLDQGVTVDVKVVPAGDYEAKLATLLAGGAEMDSYMQKRQADMFAQYANGYIAELDSFVAADSSVHEAIDSYRDAVEVNGKVLAMPFRGAGYYLYYNKLLFNNAGVPTPDEFIEKGEWTWDKYEEVSRSLSSGDGSQFGSLWYTWGICQAPKAFQEGVRLISPDGEIEVDDSIFESFRMRKRLEEDNVIPKLIDLKVTKTHYTRT